MDGITGTGSSATSSAGDEYVCTSAAIGGHLTLRARRPHQFRAGARRREEKPRMAPRHHTGAGRPLPVAANANLASAGSDFVPIFAMIDAR